ncbi:MAG: hypothetical protein LWX07_01665 [Bacteroidetes bacterium]|nr:hypothetical protein [Bacteroidota bacterium]
MLRVLYIFVPSFDYYAKSFPVSFNASEQVSDAKTYVKLADGLLEKGYPSVNGKLVMFSGYVYPFVLAVFLFLTRNLILLYIFQAALSASVCLMTAKISTMISRNENHGLISGYLWAFYYPAFMTISRPLTEPVFIFIFVGTILFVVSRIRKHDDFKIGSYVLAGLLISIAALTRAMLFYVFFIMLAVYFVYTFINTRKADYKIIFTVLAFVILQVPWTYLGYNNYGRITLGSSNGGGNLLLGTYIKGGGEYSQDVFGDPDHPIHLFDSLAARYQWSDAQKDSAYFESAKIQIKDNIKNHPLESVRLMVYQISRFWLNVPFNHKSGIGNNINIFATIVLMVFMFYGYVRLRRINKGISEMLFILIFLFCLPHAITISILRYSFPIIPLMYIFSGFGIYSFYEKIKNRRKGKISGGLR